MVNLKKVEIKIYRHDQELLKDKDITPQEVWNHFMKVFRALNKTYKDRERNPTVSRLT